MDSYCSLELPDGSDICVLLSVGRRSGGLVCLIRDHQGFNDFVEGLCSRQISSGERAFNGGVDYLQ